MAHIKSSPGHTGLYRLLRALGYSWQGLSYAWRAEAAFRQEALAVSLAIMLALLLDISTIERCLLILSCLAVLIVELLNSAIEACIDRVGPELNPLSKAAKDLGSAAVLLTLGAAAVCWGLILLG